MRPYFQSDDLILYCGDAAAVLAKLEPDSVQAALTSPPYWGLRNYGVEGQLGREPTPHDTFPASLCVSSNCDHS